jgi:hypothetical protein
LAIPKLYLQARDRTFSDCSQVSTHSFTIVTTSLPHGFDVLPNPSVQVNQHHSHIIIFFEHATHGFSIRTEIETTLFECGSGLGFGFGFGLVANVRFIFIKWRRHFVNLVAIFSFAGFLTQQSTKCVEGVNAPLIQSNLEFENEEDEQYHATNNGDMFGINFRHSQIMELSRR